MPNQLWRKPTDPPFDPLVQNTSSQQMQQATNQNLTLPMQQKARAVADAATPNKKAFYGE